MLTLKFTDPKALAKADVGVVRECATSTSISQINTTPVRPSRRRLSCASTSQANVDYVFPVRGAHELTNPATISNGDVWCGHVGSESFPSRGTYCLQLASADGNRIIGCWRSLNRHFSWLVDTSKNHC